MKIKFLGAAGTVTGSKFLISNSNGEQILVDCGLFQGVKNLRLRNWDKLGVDLSRIKAILLTHAHIDHSGYIPKFVKDGFRGKIICTHATKALAEVLLRDSAKLKEEESERANRKQYSKHQPALPLYTDEDVTEAMGLFQGVNYKEEHWIGGFKFKFSTAGHILGAASALIEADGTSVLFSGDIGRFEDPLMQPPAYPKHPQYIVMESTYGNRLHAKIDSVTAIKDVLEKVFSRKAVLLIPSFAVGRAQLLMLLIYEAFKNKPHLRMPVYLNSPMASTVTNLYKKFAEEHKLDLKLCEEVFSCAHFVSTIEESKSLNELTGPMVIISASGMLTGGRILHHLQAFGGDPNNIILLVGYQAIGTRGAYLAQGEKQIKFYGYYHDINAEVINYDFLSAHADQTELMQWLGHYEEKPKRVFLVHGEPEAADRLRLKIEEELKLDVKVAGDGEEVELT